VRRLEEFWILDQEKQTEKEKDAVNRSTLIGLTSFRLDNLKSKIGGACHPRYPSSILFSDLLFLFRLIELLRTQSFSALPAFTFFSFFRGELLDSFFNSNNTVGLRLAEALAVNLFDENR